MRLFTFRPALTIKGRKFKGLRGWAGKPLHPPLTDIPVGAYVIAPVLDVASRLTDSRELYRAATVVFVVGAIASGPTVLTGVWDWLKSTPRRTQAWRTANAHAITMATVSVLVLVSLALRIGDDAARTPGPALVLSLLIVALTTVGGTLGGSLVYDYGFNVETSGDHPVWHETETDVLPGKH